MKWIYPVLAFAFMAACSKSGTTPSPTPSGNYRQWVQNWYAGDTLYGTKIDAMGNAIGFDTIFTDTKLDTSYVTYRGVRYYIFVFKGYPYDTTSDRSIYGPICISTTPDTTGSIMSLEYLTTASPHKYFDRQSGKWLHQNQSIMMGDRTFFPMVNLNAYVSLTLH